MSIGKQIKKYREGHGMTQGELARLIGVSDKTVSTWELGTREPKMGSIEKIANVFGISKLDLIEERKESNPTLNRRDERDIRKTLDKALKSLENDQEGLLFDGEPLDDETKELLIASLERSIRMAKVIAKEKYTPKKYRKDADGENNT